MALLYIVRRHWSIENKLHWVLDVTYGQDRVHCKDDYLRGITTLNKYMYNFTSAVQAVLSKERGEKVAMESLKTHFCYLTSFLKLFAKFLVGARGHCDCQNAKSAFNFSQIK